MDRTARRRAGLSVVVDFGLWSRDERTALRWLFGAVGADCRTEHLPLDHETQRARLQQRSARTPEQTFTTSAEELLEWRARFQEPTAEELGGAPLPAAPHPHATWSAWAAARWPSLPDAHGHPPG